MLLGPAIVASRGRWAWSEPSGASSSVALTGVAGCQIAYFNAVTHLQVSIALLIEYLGIVLVVLWLWLRTGRAPHRATVGGVALAVLRLVLVLDVSGASSPDLVGVLWASSSAIGLAAYFVIIARAHADLPSVTLAALGMLLGAARAPWAWLGCSRGAAQASRSSRRPTGPLVVGRAQPLPSSPRPSPPSSGRSGPAGSARRSPRSSA